MKRIITSMHFFIIFIFLWVGPFSFAQNRDESEVIEDILALFEQQYQNADSLSSEDQIWTQEAFFSEQQEDILFDEQDFSQEALLAEKDESGLILAPALDVLELKEMDIIDVLRLISKKSGLNIVAGANVRGRVSIYLKNVDVRDALRIILESNHLAYIEEDGIIKVLTGKEFESRFGYPFGQKTETHIIRVDHAIASELAVVLNQIKTPQGVVIADDHSNTIIMTDRLDKIILMKSFIAKADVPLITEIFVLNHAKAQEISKKIEGFLTKNIGRVKWDERSNRLIVTDTKEKVLRIKDMVEVFDVRQKSVHIEARIVQITLSDEFRLGVNWQAIVRNYHDLTLVSDFNILQDGDKRGELSVGSLDAHDYEVLLQALQVAGDTETLSSPRVTVVNNEEAKILVGATTPYITQEVVTTAAGPVTTSETVSFIDTGVKLYVTPIIHDDDYITMKIRPEVSNVIDYVITSENNRIPIVETSQAETTVLAQDGITIVIGGLIKDEKREAVRKVPFLGDIPFLGFAFRNKSYEIRKTELVIFLTPHITTGGVSVDESQEIKLRGQKP